MKRHEIPTISKRKEQPSPDMIEMIQRRTEPFLIFGTHLPISHILSEAYLQGMRDAVQALTETADAHSRR